MVAIPKTSQYGADNYSTNVIGSHRLSLRPSLYDRDNVIADYQSGSAVKYYVTPFLDQNLSVTVVGTPDVTYYFTQDGLGSVRTLSDTSGTLKNKYDFEAFGSPYSAGTSETVDNRYTYTGREAGEVSGSPMYYRYRHKSDFRFSQRDPAQSPEWELYGYVGANPTTWVDPRGLEWAKLPQKDMWMALDDGDSLEDLATKVSGDARDWVCIWPVPDPVRWDPYPSAYECAKADVSNLTATSGPILRLNLIPGEYGSTGMRITGNSTRQVAAIIKATSQEGKTPIHWLTTYGHGGVRTFIGEESYRRIIQKVAIINQKYETAIQKRGPIRCWFTRKAYVNLVGCGSAGEASLFAEQVLRKGARAGGILFKNTYSSSLCNDITVEDEWSEYDDPDEVVNSPNYKMYPGEL